MKRDMLVLLVCLGLFSASLLAGSLMDNREEGRAVLASAPAGGHTLVLDAGHGGEDGGALSAAGDKESDINLGIVLRLDQIMGLCGVPAVLTRDGDHAIYDPEAQTLREKKVSDLHNRVKLIEGLENPVLLSVHQNSYPDPRYSGAQVFYGGGEDSRLWGEYTQEVLRLGLDEGNNRKAKKIPDTVYLMNHVTCPAVLVECGFMSNGAEASLLLTAGYQTKVAAALAGACLSMYK